MNMKKKYAGLKTTLNEPSTFPINVVLKAALIQPQIPIKKKPR